MKTTFNLIYLILVITSLNSYAQSNDICYSVTTRQMQKLPSTIDFSSITTDEALNSRIVTYKQRFREYFDNDNHHITESQYLYHQNLFPTWYMVPDMIEINHEGVTNHFYSTTTIFEGGWSGADHTSVSSNGYYEVGLKGSLSTKQYKLPYTSEERLIYNQANQLLLTNTILTSKVFSTPSKTILVEYQNAGYIVEATNQIIKVKGNETMMIWNTSDKTIEYVTYSGGSISSTSISSYKFNTEVNEYLLHIVETTTPYTLSSGDCGEEIVIEYYSDYAFGCGNDPDVASNRSKQQDDFTQQLRVFPNPANDQVNIELNELSITNKNAEIMVYNAFGSVVLRKVIRDVSSLSLDVSGFQSGMYNITVCIDSDFYTDSFIKQ